MEFIGPNYFETTTGFTLTDNTALVYNILYRDTAFRWSSNVNPNGTTTAVTLTYSFDATTTIDRLALMQHNWREFRIFYNGSTASTIALDSGHTALLETTASYWQSNTLSAMYLKFTPINCTSLTIDIYATDTATGAGTPELGYLVATELLTDFDGIKPTASNFRTNKTPKQIVHELGDGSIKVQNIKNKYSAELNLIHIGDSVASCLYDIYNYDGNFHFIHSPTQSANWNEIAVPCVWVGDYGFNDYTSNIKENGRSGMIRISEISE